MRLSEKLSRIIYNIPASFYLKAFNDHSFEKVLNRANNFLTSGAREQVTGYVRSTLTGVGGFANRAGEPDLYYTLFGFFVAGMLDLSDLFSPVGRYVSEQARDGALDDVHLYCAAILSVKLENDGFISDELDKKIKSDIIRIQKDKTAYNAFLILMTCYYLKNYGCLYKFRKFAPGLKSGQSMPCAVNAASVVIQKSLGNPVGRLVSEILALYDGKGGFRAVKNAPVADLLSTAVALYALSFAGYDLRKMKPDCLEFIDSLYCDGGFAATLLDPDPDIEYTFYGLLALGSLA